MTTYCTKIHPKTTNISLGDKDGLNFPYPRKETSTEHQSDSIKANYLVIINTLYFPHCRVLNHLQRDFDTHSYCIKKSKKLEFKNDERVIEKSFEIIIADFQAFLMWVENFEMDNSLKWVPFIKVSGQITSDALWNKARYFH